jgi:hypothetical protein
MAAANRRTRNFAGAMRLHTTSHTEELAGLSKRLADLQRLLLQQENKCKSVRVIESNQAADTGQRGALATNLSCSTF